MHKVSLFPPTVCLVCHPPPFVQLLASGKNSTTFKADKTQSVIQEENKLIYSAGSTQSRHIWFPSPFLVLLPSARLSLFPTPTESKFYYPV